MSNWSEQYRSMMPLLMVNPRPRAKDLKYEYLLWSKTQSFFSFQIRKVDEPRHCTCPTPRVPEVYAALHVPRAYSCNLSSTNHSGTEHHHTKRCGAKSSLQVSLFNKFEQQKIWFRARLPIKLFRRIMNDERQLKILDSQYYFGMYCQIAGGFLRQRCAQRSWFEHLRCEASLQCVVAETVLLRITITVTI